MQNFSTADRKGLLKATVISLKEKKKNTTAPQLNKKKNLKQRLYHEAGQPVSNSYLALKLG